MREFRSSEEILDFAIEEEQSAADFYAMLAEQIKSSSVRKMFLEFGKEELLHKSKLEGLKRGSIEYLPTADVVNLGLGEILVDVVPTGIMDYQDALILAIKKEKAAFQLYTRLAEIATDPAVKDLLLGLANQEARHKLHFETEYDEHILTED